MSGDPAQPTDPFAANAGTLPPLAEFLRWLVDMPQSCRAEPVGFPNGRITVHAVVADLFETYFEESPDDSFLAAFRYTRPDKVERNRLRWILAACHLLWHPALRARSVDVASLSKLLVQELAALAAVVSVDALFEEEDRREELVRRTLRALTLQLPNENAKESEDRLTQLDSIEHRRLIRDAAEREKRAREVRDMMARRAAEEAAAKVSRE